MITLPIACKRIGFHVEDVTVNSSQTDEGVVFAADTNCEIVKLVPAPLT